MHRFFDRGPLASPADATAVADLACSPANQQHWAAPRIASSDAEGVVAPTKAPANQSSHGGVGQRPQEPGLGWSTPPRRVLGCRAGSCHCCSLRRCSKRLHDRCA